MSVPLHISLAAEPIFTLGSFHVTNAMLAGVIGSTTVAVIAITAAHKATVRPRSKFAAAFEAACEVLLTMIEQVTNDRKRALNHFPLLATLFLFILANNWIGLLPGVGPVTIETAEGTIPLFRAATADLNMTLALAVLSVVLTQVYAIQRLGLWKHLKKYVSLNPMKAAIGFLEVISEFSKILSFSFRLFGNIFAGEVLLLVIGYLVPVFVPLPFFVLELFVGIIQALVFTFLTLVFMEVVSADHDEHAEEQHEQKGQARDAPPVAPAGETA